MNHELSILNDIFISNFTKIDEQWLSTTLTKIIVNNFCTPREPDDSRDSAKNESSAVQSANYLDSPVKAKKAVTFKTGLVSERERSVRRYYDALISKDHVNFIFSFVSFLY